MTDNLTRRTGKRRIALRLAAQRRRRRKPIYRSFEIVPVLHQPLALDPARRTFGELVPD